MKLGEVEAYTRTFSCYSGWKDAHPEVKSRAEGGDGDVIDVMWDQMVDSIPEWKAMGERWRETEVASTNYKEAFSLFDKRGNGRVTLDSLGDLLRACGQNPTLAEIRDLERSVGGESKRTSQWENRRSQRALLFRSGVNMDSFFAVDFETFSKILNRPGGFRDPGEPEEYCRGFQVFDKDMTGSIGVGQLKYILTNLGEKMTDEEVDELLKAVDTSSGQVNYTDLVRTILAN
ncbi:hypothetical protein NUW58_g8342 [Xylaria curta]|uniref:Uncharacterized protein n=1 Tax=Xylaria curta TaxID=42375 RepID=A0ACC1N866_9PEZI|nr:hypothetical protein NUW58_g8342 [Xylaria curta]